MEALLARIRRRAVTLNTGPSAKDASIPEIPSSISHPSGSRLVHEHSIQRKIHPDVNSLLERYSTDGDNRPASISSHGTGALSVRASSASRQRRHSIDAPPTTGPQLSSLVENKEEESETRIRGQSEFAAHHRQLTASSEWATFGRINKVTSEERINATRHTSSHNTPSSIISEVLQPIGTSRNNSKLHLKTSSDSSIPKSIHASSNSVSRRASQNENPWMAAQFTSTPRSTVNDLRQSGSNVPRDVTTSTPHTFGRPTPPQSSFSFGSSLKEFGVLSSTPKTIQSEWYDDPPPLPPLDHPAFAERRGQRTTRESSSTSAPGLPSPSFIFSPGRSSHSQRQASSSSRFKQHRAFRSVPALPLARSHQQKSSQSSSRNRRSDTSKSGSKFSLPARLEKASLSAPSGIDSPSIFSPSHLGTKLRRGRSRSRRRRGSAASETSTRRSSAEWSAHHASFVSGSPGPMPEAWPALVSREILRISGVLPPAAVAVDPHDTATSQSELASANFSNRLVASSQQSGPDLDSDDLSDITCPSGSPMTTPVHKPEALRSSTLQEGKGKGKKRASRTSSVDSARRGFPSLDGSLGGTPRSVTFNGRAENDNPPAETPQRTKRKAEDADHDQSPEGTPLDKTRPTVRATSFAADVKDNHRHGSLSRPPSSYRRKRARLSFQGGSQETSQNGQEQLDSNTNTPARPPSRTPSQAASARSHNNNNTRNLHTPQTPHRPSSRRSMSQASIPISALLSPHAPSISRSSTFHMRDPRRPKKKLARTGWTLEFSDEYEMGSPIHAWFFFMGFVLFPLWWAAAVWRTPETRRLQGEDQEKAVWVDDPQVEHDAKSWRFRCRVMSGISLVTYIPFIVLMAVFASK